jgi:hypothetical protein
MSAETPTMLCAQSRELGDSSVSSAGLVHHLAAAIALVLPPGSVMSSDLAIGAGSFTLRTGFTSGTLGIGTMYFAVFPASVVVLFDGSMVFDSFSMSVMILPDSRKSDL